MKRRKADVAVPTAPGACAHTEHLAADVAVATAAVHQLEADVAEATAAGACAHTERNVDTQSHLSGMQLALCNPTILEQQ
eukprot:5667770-Amphidinium_carterae.1